MAATCTTTPIAPEPIAIVELVPPVDPEERLTIDAVEWTEYVNMNDTLVERSNPRMIYCRGRLTLVAKSRLHEWLAEYLGVLVRMVASRLRIECEPSGETTFRKQKADAGLECDRTFHFGGNAVHMRGPKNVDLSIDPPPDLAIEVEVNHSAERAMEAWSRLGVPEIWRFNAKTWTCTIWKREEAGDYILIERSQFLPLVDPLEIAAQMRASQSMGGSDWLRHLESWIDRDVKPRAADVT